MTTTKKCLLPLVMILLLATVLTASASEPARSQDPFTKDPDNLSVNPVIYVSENGDFQIEFPGGCGKLVTRANEPDLFGGEEWNEIIQVTYVFCDRYQKSGEGCSVNATYNLTGDDGGMAGPQQVIRRIQATMGEYGVELLEQKVIKKDFGNEIIAAGVEVRAKAKDSPGEVWIRGLLIDGDVYILTAWKETGEVWGNPDYVSFFNSFQPWTD